MDVLTDVLDAVELNGWICSRRVLVPQHYKIPQRFSAPFPHLSANACLQRKACALPSGRSSDGPDQAWERSLMETDSSYLRYLAGGIPTSRLNALRKATSDS